MNFFLEMNAAKGIGLALVIAGAIVTFSAKRITKNGAWQHRELVCKICGLAAVMAGLLTMISA